MTPKYRAYHPGKPDADVLTADLAQYPIRTTDTEAVQDMQRALAAQERIDARKEGK